MRELLLQEQTDRDTSSVYLCVYGHFYQPERSDPFTGMIPTELGAHPYANFNEKIAAECYQPNAECGNFALISYDLGPTLASYLQRAYPHVYQRIIDADRQHMRRYGVGNALAQAYNHTILPLASTRDKQTQIRWGLSDFLHRFGREARGMWCPETAVDCESLDLLARFGITYTVLAPWQVKGVVDPTEPYLVQLKDGRSITVFIYNHLSGSVSFDDRCTTDANQFAHSYQQHYLHHEKAQAGIPQLTTLATDGELYGHHKPHRERFLSHLLQRSAPAYGLEPCTLERYLHTHPARRTVEIVEQSSWSCMHGINRWSIGCACTEGDGGWKQALRSALVHLAERIDTLFERYTQQTLYDPWAARDDFLSLRNGWESPERFWKRHSITGCLGIEQVQRTRQLLEAEFWLQYSQTSCGFFFEDLDRIEPRNDIAFARRAISLVFEATGIDLQESFIQDLACARSWRTGRTGADVYCSLPPLPASLLPPCCLGEAH